MKDTHTDPIVGTGKLVTGEEMFSGVAYAITVSGDGRGTGILNADFLSLVGTKPSQATLQLEDGHMVTVHLNQIFLNEHLAHVTTLGHAVQN